MVQLQEWIHRLEVGEGTRYVRFLTAILGFFVLAGFYAWTEFRFLEVPAAIDAAQVARNVARGEGFTTKFIRPLGIHLLEQQATQGTPGSDPARLRSPHPDLVHPPVYPLLLAGAMKLVPIDPEIPAGRPFSRYRPDLLIAGFNGMVFFALLGLVFLLARGLFDAPVAWMSALLVAGSAPLWAYSVSGLPTLLLTLLFTGVVFCLRRLERDARPDAAGTASLVAGAAALGLVLGLGTLTRYSFGFLALPALLFLAWFAGRRRLLLLATTAAVFLLVVTPWLARNQRLCGHPFGIAGYAAIADTAIADGERLQRTLGEPQISESVIRDICRKALQNGRVILGDKLPVLGGSWIAAFFLVGLLLPFSDPSRSRLRWFLVWSLVLLAVVQAVVQSPNPGSDRPEGLDDNLLIWCAPLVFVFGAAVFFTVLDPLELVFPQAKALVTAAVVLVCWMPLIMTLLLPPRLPDRTPAAYPPLVQRVAHWVAPDSLMMSDVPWAVAWFGDRQCVWNTLEVQSPQGNDFYAIHDLRKPVHGLYLSARTLDLPLFSEIYQGAGSGWGRFALEGLVRTNIPSGFPLKHSPQGFLHRGGQLFLSDEIRWQER
jgi:hypothetical protein